MNPTKKQSTKLEKWLIGLAIFYIAISPILYVLLPSLDKAAVFTLISGVLLAILSRFRDVTELQLLGLKAKIERALQEAAVTLEQVKGLAEFSAIASLSNTARSGWIGGIPDKQSMEMLKSVEQTLSGLGFEKKEIEKITADYHDCILVGYKHGILAGGSSTVPSGLEKLSEDDKRECQKEWGELRSAPVSPPLHPDKLKAFLEKYGFLDQDLTKRLKDYAHYYEHHEFNDFSDYENREKWPSLTKRIWE